MGDRPKDKAVIFRRYTWKIFDVFQEPSEFQKWLDNDPEIISTQWGSDFRTVAVIFIKEQKWVSHKEKDDTLEYADEPPDSWKTTELHQMGVDTPVETPLGEVLDDNPIEEDYEDNSSDQQSLFNDEE